MNGRLTKSIVRLPLWQVDALAAAIVCLGAGVWYFAGFAPLVQARAARQGLESQLTEDHDALDKQHELVKKWEGSLSKLRSQSTESRVQLKAVDYVNQQVQGLTRMAEKCGLKVDEIKPLAPIPQERFTTVPIKVSGTGVYAAMTEFLGTLRADFHDTGVLGFSLGGVPDKPEEPLKFVINLVWYAAPPAARAEKKQP